MLKSSNTIVIVGSSNTDLVVRVDHFPKAGETIIGTDFMTAQGGKGANQAVAVARLGGEAVFVARLGSDTFGETTLTALRKEGIILRHVQLTPGVASGVATITVDSHGENSIVVASGANALLTPQDVLQAAADISQPFLELALNELELWAQDDSVLLHVLRDAVGVAQELHMA